MKRRESLGSSEDGLKESLRSSLALNHRLHRGNIVSEFVKVGFVHHCQDIFLQFLNINLKLVKLRNILHL